MAAAVPEQLGGVLLGGSAQRSRGRLGEGLEARG
jgi:hypothetical protein